MILNNVTIRNAKPKISNISLLMGKEKCPPKTGTVVGGEFRL
jgi:hypothetical protein